MFWSYKLNLNLIFEYDPIKNAVAKIFHFLYSFIGGCLHVKDLNNLVLSFKSDWDPISGCQDIPLLTF